MAMRHGRTKPVAGSSDGYGIPERNCADEHGLADEAKVLALATSRVGAPVSALTNRFVVAHQRGIGWDRLPLAHHALLVDQFARQHAASVHRELQNAHALFFAIELHMGSGRQITHTPRRFLHRGVVQHRPKISQRTVFLNRVGINVISARGKSPDDLPICVSSLKAQERNCNSQRFV